MDEAEGHLVQHPSLEERWPAPTWPGARRRVVAACAAAIAFHAGLIVGTGWLDQFRDRRPTAEQATPVEVVEEMPQEKPEASPEPNPAEEAKPAPEPTPAPAPAPAAAPPPVPPPAPVPAVETPAPAVAPQKPVEVDASHGDVSGDPSAKPDEAPKADDKAPSGQAASETPLKEPPYPSEADAATAEHRFTPPSFRGAALPGASVQSQESYKNLVYGMLERAKQLPARTPTRQGTMVAYVRFMVDRAGNLVSLSLLGSTGDAGLDAEALALVRRAAPFPKPPNEGTLLTFTPAIYFVYDE